MSILKIGFRLLKNIIKHIVGRSFSYPSFISGVMGKDDAALCREWLKKPREWFNEDVIKEFTREFAVWNGSKFAFAFMGGREALSACIYALDLKPGDEVIVPGYTCVVVTNAFHYAGINMVFSDIELDTYGLCAERLIEKIGPGTKVILLHHMYGLVCRDYEKIIEIARNHHLYVIEDCAQSVGAEYNGKKVGNFGDVAIYSSEQSKAFTTGQGGIASTNDPEFAKRLEEFYRDTPFPDSERITGHLITLLFNYYVYAHPRNWFWKDWADYKYGDRVLPSAEEGELQGIKPAGYGRKMPAPLASIGLNQLRKLDNFNRQRRENALYWDRWSQRSGYKIPLVIEGSIPIFLRYPVMTPPEKKEDLTWAARELSVRPGVWFKTHIHPSSSSSLSYAAVTGCPNADKAVAGCINLPTLGIKRK